MSAKTTVNAKARKRKSNPCPCGERFIRWATLLERLEALRDEIRDLPEGALRHNERSLALEYLGYALDEIGMGRPRVRN